MGQNQPLELSEEEEKNFATRKKPKYSTRDQLAFDVLAEFAVATSHVITEIMGEKQAEELVRSEWYHAGLASALNIRNRMELEGQGPHFAAYVLNWFNVVWVDLKVELTSVGFRWTTTSCPWSRASSAICCMHEYIGKAVCEIFSPEFFAPGYTILLPKNLARGDDACLAIIAKEGVDPDKVLNSQCTCEPLSPPLAQEDMVLWNHSYMGGVWVALLKSTLADISPEITTNTLVPKFKEMGREFANRITEEYRITTDNLSSVVDGLNSFHSSFLKMGRVRKSQDGFVMITEECPFSGEPPEACHLFQCFYDGLLEEINPEFVMKCSTMMTKGDKTCHWTIRKKEGARREKSKEESSQDDPIKRLTNKFIDGEITAEELEKKLAHLRKLGLVN